MIIDEHITNNTLFLHIYICLITSVVIIYNFI